jgi:hypothetical protein
VVAVSVERTIDLGNVFKGIFEIEGDGQSFIKSEGK